MIKTNLEKLVDLAVSGNAGHPAACDSGEKTAFDGGSYMPLRLSGINFTVKVGDPAFDWAGAHEVSPGVAIKNCCEEANEGLLALSCIGNEAVIVDAKMEGKDAKLKGAPGVVTGKLGTGHVLVYAQAGLNDIVQLVRTKIQGTFYYVTVPAVVYGEGDNDTLDACG